MKVRFWGVRGSIASPGPETAGVGGNTSCVEIVAGSERIILDAGTGLRRLGDELLRQGAHKATLLLSHFHWDHIQGLPFFAPAYLPATELHIVSGSDGRHTLREKLCRQMTEPHFPVQLDDLSATLSMREVKPGQTFAIGDARVTVARLNHPGGVYAYRVEHEGSVVVFATDTEHYACLDPVLHKLAKGADVLIYDAQYTPEEYAGSAGRSKVGWGHSTFVAGAELATAADVGKLVLFHHDPQRTDAGVADIEARARALFVDSVAAREGMAIDLGPAVSERAA